MDTLIHALNTEMREMDALKATAWDERGPLSDSKHDARPSWCFTSSGSSAGSQIKPRSGHCWQTESMSTENPCDASLKPDTGQLARCGLMHLANGEYLACTSEESVLRRTEAGALGWLAQRGLDGQGRPMVRIDLLADPNA